MREIRPARDHEVDEVAALWGEMYEFQQTHGMLLPLHPEAVQIYRKEIAGRLDSALSVVLVSEGEDGRLAGFLHGQIKRLPAVFTRDNPKVGYVGAVYVRPAARRSHLGKALVEAAFEWFKRSNVGSVELQVIHGNELARYFWESVGFRPEILQMRAPVI